MGMIHTGACSPSPTHIQTSIPAAAVAPNSGSGIPSPPLPLGESGQASCRTTRTQRAPCRAGWGVSGGSVASGRAGIVYNHSNTASSRSGSDVHSHALMQGWAGQGRAGQGRAGRRRRELRAHCWRMQGARQGGKAVEAPGLSAHSKLRSAVID